MTNAPNHPSPRPSGSLAPARSARWAFDCANPFRRFPSDGSPLGGESEIFVGDGLPRVTASRSCPGLISCTLSGCSDGVTH